MLFLRYFVSSSMIELMTYVWGRKNSNARMQAARIVVNQDCFAMIKFQMVHVFIDLSVVTLVLTKMAQSAQFSDKP